MKKRSYTQQGNEENDNESGMFPFQMSMRTNNTHNEDDDDFEDFFENRKHDNKKQKLNASESYYNKSINVTQNKIKNQTQHNSNKSHNKKTNKDRAIYDNNNEYTRDDKEDNNKHNIIKITTKEKVDPLASQFYSKPVYTKETQSHYDIRTSKNESKSVAVRTNNSKNNAQIQESYFEFSQQNNNIKQPSIQSNNKQKYENQLGTEDDMKYNSISKENKSILKHIQNFSELERIEPIPNKYNINLYYDSDYFSDKDEPTPITFKSEVLLNIINKLQISETFPFWYIRISDTEYSEGPKSTMDIINEYNANQLNNENQIRPIDVFQPINNEDKFMLLCDINHISKEDDFFNKYKINDTIIGLKGKYDDIKKEMYEKKFSPQKEELKSNKQNRLNKRKKKQYKSNFEEQQIKTGFQIDFKG